MKNVFKIAAKAAFNVTAATTADALIAPVFGPIGPILLAVAVPVDTVKGIKVAIEEAEVSEDDHEVKNVEYTVVSVTPITEEEG